MPEIHSLEHLPPECLFLIADCFSHPRDLNAAAQTCHLLYSVYIPLLYSRASKVKSQNQLFRWAIEHGCPTTVRLCIAAGADPNRELTPGQGDSPLFNTVAFRDAMRAFHGTDAKSLKQNLQWNCQVAQAFIDGGANIDARSRGTWYMKDMSALHQATWDGDADMTRLLLDNGADISAVDGRGRTPLHTAVNTGNPEVVAILLAKGATADDRHRANGQTPLHELAARGKIDAMKVLLGSGADVNACDDLQQTPLHHAAKSRYDSAGADNAAQLLISKGSNIEARDKKGRTPLLLSISWHWSMPVIKTLVSNRADVDARDSNGKSPMDLAELCHNTVTARYLAGQWGSLAGRKCET